MMLPVDVWIGSGGRIIVADASAARIRELVPTEAVAPTPSPIVARKISILHAATLLEQSIAPGQLVVVRGDDLIDDGHILPAETEITFDGRPAAVLSVSKGEIIAQLPVTLAAGIAEVVLSHRGKERGRLVVSVAAVAPALFALAANEDGTRNSVADPAPRGSIVTLYGTGSGAESIQALVTVGGIDADVVYAGPAPGQPGVFQVNARTPAGFAPSGVVPLTLVLNGASAQAGLTIVTR
jgi:uncharacterized protein (TIGR03437 family)